MSNFRPVDRATPYLLLPSVDEWLPVGHLARFVVEIVDQLDLRGLESAYRGSGKAAYHPAMLTGLLIYGYATGTYIRAGRSRRRVTIRSRSAISRPIPILTMTRSVPSGGVF